MSCGYSKTLDFGRGFVCTEIAPKMVKTIIPIINLLRTCISKEVVQEALSHRKANSPNILLTGWIEAPWVNAANHSFAAQPLLLSKIEN